MFGDGFEKIGSIAISDHSLEFLVPKNWSLSRLLSGTVILRSPGSQEEIQKGGAVVPPDIYVNVLYEMQVCLISSQRMKMVGFPTMICSEVLWLKVLMRSLLMTLMKHYLFNLN